MACRLRSAKRGSRRAWQAPRGAGNAATGRDEKLLTSWKRSHDKGPRTSGPRSGEPAWLASARRALDSFARTWRPDLISTSARTSARRLCAKYRRGVAHLHAILDDHALLLEALSSSAGDFCEEDLVARETREILLQRFETVVKAVLLRVHDKAVIHRPSRAGRRDASGNASPRMHATAGDLVENRLSSSGRALPHPLFYPAMNARRAASESVRAKESAPPQIVSARRSRRLATWQRASRSVRPATLVVPSRPGWAASCGADNRCPGARVSRLVWRVTCLPPYTNW